MNITAAFSPSTQTVTDTVWPVFAHKKQFKALFISILFMASSTLSNATDLATHSANNIYSCPTGGDVREISPLNKDKKYLIKGENGNFGEVTWKGDINGDGTVDYIVFWPDTCGNWGGCEESVYASCGDKKQYISVWGPELTLGLDVAKSSALVNGRRWIDLADTQRSGDGYSTDQQIIRFDGEKYDTSLSHLYAKAMQWFKRKNPTKAYSTLNWYFLGHDFRDLTRVNMSKSEYANILNDYVFFIQINYEHEIKHLCNAMKGATSTDEATKRSYRNDMLNMRTKMLPEAKAILEFVVQQQPERTVAYLNLADVLYEMDMEHGASLNYEKYLELAHKTKIANIPTRATDPSSRRKYYNCN